MMATRDIRVEFGDCDPAGIVYYPNYFRMFDNCTAHLFETALGMTKPRWVKHYGVLGIPMVDTGAKFHRPATHGDTVRVESRVTAIGSAGADHRRAGSSGNDAVGRSARRNPQGVRLLKPDAASPPPLTPPHKGEGDSATLMFVSTRFRDGASVKVSPPPCGEGQGVGV